MRLASRIVLFVVVCAAVSACSTSGPRMVKVNATLQSKDQPLKIDPKGSVTVVFTPIVEQGAQFTTYSGSYSAEEPNFVVNLPEGKYKISLLCMVPEPTSETENINQKFSKENTPIIREVKSGPEPLVIDLAKEGK